MEKEEKIKELEERIEELKEQNDLAELVLSYSILADVCKLKAMQVLEEEDVNLEILNDWKKKADEYKQLNKETIPKIDVEKYLKEVLEERKLKHIL